MVARTTRCGWAISQTTSDWHVNFTKFGSWLRIFCFFVATSICCSSSQCSPNTTIGVRKFASCHVDMLYPIRVRHVRPELCPCPIACRAQWFYPLPMLLCVGRVIVPEVLQSSFVAPHGESGLVGESSVHISPRPPHPLSATSHMRLGARDHYTSSTLIGGERWSPRSNFASH